MKKNSPTYILTFMTLICIFFGVAVSAVHYATQDLLARNEQLHRNRILAQAFMLDVEGEGAEAYEQAVENNLEAYEVDGDERTRMIYRHKTEDMLGFVIWGMGFWDRITAILVLTPDLEKVVNIKFFDHKETPGLGARIEDDWFTDQFKGVDIAWENAADSRIVIGPSPEPNPQNRVDAITGATQTSMALMNFLNVELQRIRDLRESGALEKAMTEASGEVEGPIIDG
jgi:Na+-transporting NADH:ubiquinone oxidoreductase subunit C